MRSLSYLCCIVGWIGLLGCSTADRQNDGTQMVYVNTQDQEAVVSAVASEFPARHPNTGERTLMPALYCAKCLAWRAVPPAVQINRSPGATECQACQTMMSIDGPWPQKRLGGNQE